MQILDEVLAQYENIKNHVKNQDVIGLEESLQVLSIRLKSLTWEKLPTYDAFKLWSCLESINLLCERANVRHSFAPVQKLFRQDAVSIYTYLAEVDLNAENYAQALEHVTKIQQKTNTLELFKKVLNKTLLELSTHSKLSILSKILLQCERAINIANRQASSKDLRVYLYLMQGLLYGCNDQIFSEDSHVLSISALEKSMEIFELEQEVGLDVLINTYVGYPEIKRHSKVFIPLVVEALIFYAATKDRNSVKQGYYHSINIEQTLELLKNKGLLNAAYLTTVKELAEEKHHILLATAIDRFIPTLVNTIEEKPKTKSVVKSEDSVHPHLSILKKIQRCIEKIKSVHPKNIKIFEYSSDQNLEKILDSTGNQISAKSMPDLFFLMHELLSQLDPSLENYLETHLSLGLLAFEFKKYKEAKTIYNLYASNSEEARFQLGLIHLQQAKNAKEAGQFRLALKFCEYHSEHHEIQSQLNELKIKIEAEQALKKQELEQFQISHTPTWDIPPQELKQLIKKLEIWSRNFTAHMDIYPAVNYKRIELQWIKYYQDKRFMFLENGQYVYSFDGSNELINELCQLFEKDPSNFILPLLIGKIEHYTAMVLKFAYYRQGQMLAINTKEFEKNKALLGDSSLTYYKGSELSFSFAKAIDPAHSETLFLLADSLKNLGRNEEALKIYLTMQGEDYYAQMARIVYIQLCAKMGRYDLIYEKILQLLSEVENEDTAFYRFFHQQKYMSITRLYVTAGEIAQNLDLYSEAKAFFERALQQHRSSPCFDFYRSKLKVTLRSDLEVNDHPGSPILIQKNNTFYFYNWCTERNQFLDPIKIEGIEFALLKEGILLHPGTSVELGADHYPSLFCALRAKLSPNYLIPSWDNAVEQALNLIIQKCEENIEAKKQHAKVFQTSLTFFHQRLPKEEVEDWEVIPTFDMK